MALYAFDGTWNSRKDAGEYDKNTNVVRFVDAYTGEKELFKGVGTSYGWLGKLLGGAFGVGGKRRIRNASRTLFEHYPEDRAIDIVGFSRGSALALHFANRIYRKGIRHPDTGERIGERRPEIRFLGLFDVVASFGIPIDIGIPFQRLNLGYRLKLPANVRCCFHALALDERRSAFRPTRVDGGYEVWFRGVHSDVGGGNENRGLNDISFRWMLRKADLVGLPIDAAALEELRVDPDAEIKPARMEIGRSRPRKFRPDDRWHYTVGRRDGQEHNNPAPDVRQESEEDEVQRFLP